MYFSKFILHECCNYQFIYPAHLKCEKYIKRNFNYPKV